MPRSWTSILLDLFFPPRCMGCGRRSSWLCPHCYNSIQPVPGFTVPASILIPLHFFKGLYAACYFEGVVRHGIHGLKYRGQQALAEPLAELMLPAFDAMPAVPTVIVPVPLYPARQQERGYNQSELLARKLSQLRQVEVESHAIQRVRDTPPQMGLSAAERRTNVAGAFMGTPGTLRGRDVLILDDVCTTGSTLEACAAAARQSGARRVWGLVLARAR